MASHRIYQGDSGRPRKKSVIEMQDFHAPGTAMAVAGNQASLRPVLRVDRAERQARRAGRITLCAARATGSVRDR